MAVGAQSGRRSGVLLHPTSLPGPYGCGDLGAAAGSFVDWLAAARQSIWQMLPVGIVGPGNSPYMSPSAFAGNPLLIDLDDLRSRGWLEAADLADPPVANPARVDYAAAHRFRMGCLRRAARRFADRADVAATGRFADYCASAADWLDDHALFMAIAESAAGRGRAWQDWPADLVQRDPAVLARARESLGESVAFWKFCAWTFSCQWDALKLRANSRGIELVGDLPIYVAAGSSDVWAHPELFELGPDGRPAVVAGVPPDYFSAEGQRWGNPLYRWPAHAADGYRWWRSRIERMLAAFDRVRVDHFRGFESYWEIPAAAPTAIAGRWRTGPGAAPFAALASGATDIGRRIIAEDLGIITPAVTALRESLGMPGMRILQFAFDGRPDNPYLPHNFATDTVVYTGTHDNDTTVGWWQNLTEEERDRVRRTLGCNASAIHWDLIRAASASVAALSVVPMQDVLGLGGTERMNTPGLADGAWAWRFAWEQLAPWQAATLADLAEVHGRWPGDPRRESAQAQPISSR